MLVVRASSSLTVCTTFFVVGAGDLVSTGAVESRFLLRADAGRRNSLAKNCDHDTPVGSSVSFSAISKAYCIISVGVR